MTMTSGSAMRISASALCPSSASRMLCPSRRSAARHSARLVGLSSTTSTSTASREVSLEQRIDGDAEFRFTRFGLGEGLCARASLVFARSAWRYTVHHPPASARNRASSILPSATPRLTVTRSDVGACAVREIKVVHCLANPLGQEQRGVSLRVGHQRDELLAAVASDDVLGTTRGLDALGDAAQALNPRPGAPVSR